MNLDAILEAEVQMYIDPLKDRAAQWLRED
jgi:hypothetical protein